MSASKSYSKTNKKVVKRKEKEKKNNRKDCEYRKLKGWRGVDENEAPLTDVSES